MSKTIKDASLTIKLPSKTLAELRSLQKAIKDMENSHGVDGKKYSLQADLVNYVESIIAKLKNRLDEKDRIREMEVLGRLGKHDDIQEDLKAYTDIIAKKFEKAMDEKIKQYKEG